MILMTGASGNVGSEVLTPTAAAKLRIRAAYQSVEKAKRAPAGVQTVLMDYLNPETIGAALKGIEKIILVGPATLNIAELESSFVNEAKKSGVKHLQRFIARAEPAWSIPPSSASRDAKRDPSTSLPAITGLPFSRTFELSARIVVRGLKA